VTLILARRRSNIRLPQAALLDLTRRVVDFGNARRDRGKAADDPEPPIAATVGEFLR
jgi:hypothetical protein